MFATLEKILNYLEVFIIERQPAIYIMTNKYHGAIYTGVTSGLVKRIYQHKYSDIEGFTKRYGCHWVVYFEMHGDIQSAIEREKQIKSRSRKNKLSLIEKMNPKWLDLYYTLLV